MLSPVQFLWAILSVVVTVTCTFSFWQPIWFTHPDHVHSFGLYGYCRMDAGQLFHRQRCGYYGHEFQFGNIPSGAWQVACVLYGGGCALLTFGTLISVLTTMTSYKHVQRIGPLAGYAQVAAVLLMTAGLLTYPMGLGSPFFRYYCGSEAGFYSAGHCHMGWSYMLGAMGTALAIFCPVLSYFRDMKTEDIVPYTFV